MKRAPLSFQEGTMARLLGRRQGWISRTATAAGFLVAATLLVLALLELAEQYRRQAHLAELQAARSAAAPAAVTKRPPPRLTGAQRRRLHEIIRQLNLPWSAVLTGVERHTRPDIGVILMEPDAQKSSIRLQAEAKAIDSLLAYADGFARDPAFGGIALQQHETNEQDPNRPARLGFEVRLSGAPAAAIGGTP